MVGCELCVRIELVRFGVGGVRERMCQEHDWYCSGKNMGLLGDCEMLLAWYVEPQQMNCLQLPRLLGSSLLRGEPSILLGPKCGQVCWGKRCKVEGTEILEGTVERVKLDSG